MNETQDNITIALTQIDGFLPAGNETTFYVKWLILLYDHIAIRCPLYRPNKKY